MAIRASKIASVADDGNPAKIQPSDINLMTRPAVPVQDDTWIERSGVSPNRIISLVTFDEGEEITLVSVTR